MSHHLVYYRKAIIKSSLKCWATHKYLAEAFYDAQQPTEKPIGTENIFFPISAKGKRERVNALIIRSLTDTKVRVNATGGVKLKLELVVGTQERSVLSCTHFLTSFKMWQTHIHFSHRVSKNLANPLNISWKLLFLTH